MNLTIIRLESSQGILLCRVQLPISVIIRLPGITREAGHEERIMVHKCRHILDQAECKEKDM